MLCQALARASQGVCGRLCSGKPEQSVLLGDGVHIRVVGIQHALVDIVPDVVPRSAPVVPPDDAAADHEAVEARAALEEDLVEL
eukprot:CAMPEP_0168382342 /NCGR_PEP_ID=MMETSP0228-20121227/13346_1 /TAXON_ID=133427 /ORGANISM="Protoceratium reticulatum, Strain CCCM 535 (=CCMP 1889)" /LENGTH=83 /DNA_ID=CAMNT_0008395475 /DNA_START=66 /DNA_END=313 /DNA_ORIENTATION=-